MNTKAFGRVEVNAFGVHYIQLYSAQEVDFAITACAQQTAARINKALDTRVMVVAVLQGALVTVEAFTEALKKALDLSEIQIGFIIAKSYGDSVESGQPQKPVQIQGIETLTYTHTHVVIYDDVFDTGNTLMSVASNKYIVNNASSVTTCALVYKPRGIQRPHVYGLTAPCNAWLYGSGMDHQGRGRTQSGIFAVVNNAFS